MLLISSLREILGQGTILSQEVIKFTPLPVVSGPLGAFMIVGITGLVLEVIWEKAGIFAK